MWVKRFGIRGIPDKGVKIRYNLKRYVLWGISGYLRRGKK
jgi:hypothetical protein